MAHIKHVP